VVKKHLFLIYDSFIFKAIFYFIPSHINLLLYLHLFLALINLLFVKPYYYNLQNNSNFLPGDHLIFLKEFIFLNFPVFPEIYFSIKLNYYLIKMSLYYCYLKNFNFFNSKINFISLKILLKNLLIIMNHPLHFSLQIKLRDDNFDVINSFYFIKHFIQYYYLLSNLFHHLLSHFLKFLYSNLSQIYPPYFNLSDKV
jgi:hypothetical protein